MGARRFGHRREKNSPAPTRENSRVPRPGGPGKPTATQRYGRSFTGDSPANDAAASHAFLRVDMSGYFGSADIPFAASSRAAVRRTCWASPVASPKSGAQTAAPRSPAKQKPRPATVKREPAPVPEYVAAVGVDSTADPATVLPDPIIPKF